MTRSYHVLLVRYFGDWCIEFGDYSRSCVAQERRDCIDSLAGYLKRKDTQIVSFPSDDQSAIDAHVAKLNAK